MQRILTTILIVLGTFAALSVLLLRFLVFQPFSIPAASMAPALIPGDYVFANKFAYGYGRYSLPIRLDFAGRLWGAEPQRGDVLIFRLPGGGSTDYVKRVVGLPGDEIAMRKGDLTINGQVIQRERLDNPPEAPASGPGVIRYRETLPNGVSYEIFKNSKGSPGDDTQTFKVPAEHYFVLGDNRDNSMDSRHASVGFVPYENLIGRAAIIFFSPGDTGEEGIRWKRIFQMPH